MILAGIDPGLMTGVVAIRWNGVGLPDPPVLESWQVPFEDAPEFFQYFIPRMDILVMERYTISARTLTATRQYEALYTLGGCIFQASLSGVPVRMQMASDAKTAYPNERLSELGWKVRGRHARDALRHALLACHSRTLYAEVTDRDESESA